MENDLFPEKFLEGVGLRGGGYPLLVQLLAAAGVPFGKTRLLEIARRAGLRAEGGSPYTGDLLAAELARCIAAGLVRRGEGGLECESAHRPAAFREAAVNGRLREWRPAIWAAMYISATSAGWGHLRTFEEGVAVFRIALCTGLQGEELNTALRWIRVDDPARLHWAAFGDPFDEAVFALIAPAIQDELADGILAWMLCRPSPSASKLVEWMARRSAAGDAPASLRYRTCEHMLWQGRFDEALDRLAGEGDGFALAIKGAAAAMRRDSKQAAELYAAAVEDLRRTERRKTGLLPFTVAWLRAAALIVTGDPHLLEEAKRYCQAEGRASRAEDRLWHTLEGVAEARLGDLRPESVPAELHGVTGLFDLVMIEALAWLRHKPSRSSEAAARRWVDAYAGAGYAWIAHEFEAAISVANGGACSPAHAGTLAAAFAREAPWQRALAAIAALSDAQRNDAEETRLVWVITQESHRADVRIEPWDQKRGPRGWSKGKAASLSRLAKSDRLAARDAQVCRALKRVSGNLYEIDPDRALPALVGHPLVFFADDLGTPVELVLGEPELALERVGQGLRVVLRPDLRAVLARRTEDAHSFNPRPESKSDPCLLLRETATRARVVRVTAAHKRVAELVGKTLEIPAEGADEAKRAIGSIAHLFRVHSDVAAGLPETAGDPKIRAELAPVGVGLRLRLAVRPFGDAGPRYAPAEGGARVIADVAGERRAARRDLGAEREGATRVLEALPMLDVASSGTFEWRIDEPEECLALVEALQGLADTVSVEWPAGAGFRVTRVYGATDLKLAIRSERDWFVASGGLQLDEGQLLDMKRLVEFARASRGRFVPMGEGGFLALSDDLRRRIDELVATGEVTDAGVRVHPLAAVAIDEIAEGARIEGDAGWRTRLERLREAESLDPRVPSTLQAELRPYQLEGYRWLARLAHWGAGACLADDMGLGKTVQALALLLQRAPGGAALVVAPTSVCPNWAEEARRFAPTLNIREFGAGERAKLVAEAGEFDIVIVSYALLSQEIDLLTTRPWHTLVLDEAQAVKNFATKRAQAVLALASDFRMVTTGTPVENRLDELWTLFRFLNPGLLGSRERFNERFAAPIERHRDTGARARLRRLIRPFVLRRTKSEVLGDLPPRTEITFTVEPDERELAFYEALRRSALEAIDGGGVPIEQRRFQVLAELMRLRRACCDPRLVAPDGGVTGTKIEAFRLLVEELIANRHKALVFSQFVDYLALLRRELDTLGVDYQYLDGATPAAQRAKRVAAFQAGEGSLFLISLRAGGQGLNLTAADYVIIADPWWNPAVEDQAAGRAHRMGQERPVTVYRLVVKGSIEERIMDLHRDKRALADGLFSGEEFGAPVSVEELVRLIRED